MSYKQHPLFRLTSERKLPPFIILKGEKSLSLNFLEDIFEYYLNANGLNHLSKNILHKGHPDILVLTPPEGKSWSIKNLSELNSFLGLKSLELKDKFIIFKNANSLLKGILANKLLKTLEEPPQNTTIFYLCSSQIETILPTIKSRAQIFKITDGTSTYSRPILKNNNFHSWILRQYDKNEIDDLGETLKSYSTKQINYIQCLDQLTKIPTVHSKILKLILMFESDSNSSFINKSKTLKLAQKQNEYIRHNIQNKETIISFLDIIDSYN